MSVKVIWVYQVFCTPVGYLVARNCGNMKINHKDMPTYALQFTIWDIWSHSVYMLIFVFARSPMVSSRSRR